MLRLAYPITFTLLLAPVAVGLLMVALPAFGLISQYGESQSWLAIWQRFWSVPGLFTSIRLSLVSGLLTAMVSVAITFAYLATTSGTRFDAWLQKGISPLLAIPHAAAAFGIIFLFAPAGFVLRLISPELTGWQRPPDLLIINDPWALSLIFGLIIKEVPFLLLMSLVMLPQLNVFKRVAVARSLGYSKTLAWLKTVAPGLYPLIRLPIFAVIVFSSSTVDVALILGPNLPPTLSVRILEWFSHPDLTYRNLASAAALIQMGICLFAVGCWVLLEKAVAKIWQVWTDQGRTANQGKPLSIFAVVAIGVCVGSLFLSLLMLFLGSISESWRFPDALPSDLTLRHWESSLTSFKEPFWNSLMVSISATAIAVILVVALLEYQHRQQYLVSLSRNPKPPRDSHLWLIYLPLLVPQVAFLFGIVVATEALQLAPGIGLVIAAHLVFVLPYVYLSLGEVYKRYDQRWTQTALVLGATQNRAFLSLRLPMMSSALLAAIALGFAISISQYLPTQLLGGGRVPTITTEAVALASGGSRTTIAVWAQLQASLPLLAFALALLIPRFLWRNRQSMLSE